MLAPALLAPSTSAQTAKRWPVWRTEGNQPRAYHGNSVSTAGDVNGDGFADVVVAAYGWNGVYADEGRVDVFHGGPFGPSSRPDWRLLGGQTGGLFAAQLGYAVSTAGDVNADGYDDLLVGTGLKHPQHQARLYLGSAGGLSGLVAWLGEVTYCYALASAGDVNGDGYDDVVVANDGFTDDLPYQGEVLVYHGNAGGLPLAPSWRTKGDQAYGRFGGRVAGAGDVNDDGFDDVLVSAAEYDGAEVDQGRVYLFLGSAAGLQATPAWHADGDQESERFGAAIAGAGDVNGDGYGDVVVSAPGHSNGELGEGGHSVFLGSASGLAPAPSWTTESDQFGAAGGGVASGDLDGDGYGDVLVGYSGFDHPQLDEGAVFAYFGSPAGLTTRTRWFVESNRRYSAFGLTLSTAGDVNGDGCADVLVGAYTADVPDRDEGAAFVYLGSPARQP